MTVADLIQAECLTLPEAMLTMHEAKQEEVVSLYFRGGKLIQAFAGELWGNDALGLLYDLQITHYTIGPLPVGIETAFDHPMESLLPIFKTMTLPEKVIPVAEDIPPHPLRSLFPGLLGVAQVGTQTVEVEWMADEDASPITWGAGTVQMAQALGETLGLGRLEKMTFGVAAFQVVAFPVKKGVMMAVQEASTPLDEFEKASQHLARG